MEYRTCKQSYVLITYVGYTTSNLPKRFSNHKSHILRKVLGVASLLITF